MEVKDISELEYLGVMQVCGKELECYLTKDGGMVFSLESVARALDVTEDELINLHNSKKG